MQQHYEHGLMAYKEYIDRLEQELEIRRDYFVERLKKRAIIGGSIILAASLAAWILSPSVEYLALHPDTTTPPYGFLITLLMIGLSAWASSPIFNYKLFPHITDEGKKIKMTLKEISFQEAFRFFGDFTLTPEGGIAPALITPSRIIPNFDDFSQEDLIRGSYKETMIQICETKLFATEGRTTPAQVFKGLIILLEFPQHNHFNQPCFTGHTVIIQDAHKNEPHLQKALAGYQRVDMHSEEMEELYEALTDTPSEAQRLLHPQVVETMVTLFRTLRNASVQVKHTDDLIIALLSRLQSIAKNPVGFFRNELPVLLQQIRTQAPHLLEHIQTRIVALTHKEEATKESWQVPGVPDAAPTQHESEEPESPSGIYSIDNSLQCAFYDRKLLITLPYDHDLFEPNSVFERAFEDEDITITYAIMSVIFSLIDHVMDGPKPEVPTEIS